MSAYWMSWNALLLLTVVADSDDVLSSICRPSAASVKAAHCLYFAKAWL